MPGHLASVIILLLTSFGPPPLVSLLLDARFPLRRLFSASLDLRTRLHVVRVPAP